MPAPIFISASSTQSGFTGVPSTTQPPMGDGSPLQLSVSPSYMSVDNTEGSGQASSLVTTDTITSLLSGGIGPYLIEWSSPSPRVTPSNPDSLSTDFTIDHLGTNSSTIYMATLVVTYLSNNISQSASTIIEVFNTGTGVIQ